MGDDAIPVPSRALRESAFDYLRGEILTGRIAEGERLVERDIAERLGVSRGPVREAVRALEYEGLVVVRPYAGASVAVPDPAEIDEIIEIRRQTEYFTIANAALNATPELVEQLTALASEIGAACRSDDLTRWFDADMAFHLAIAEASGHKTLGVVMRTLLPRLMLAWYSVNSEMHTPEFEEESHLKLVRPIAEHDVEACLDAVDGHLGELYVEVELRVRRVTAPSLQRDADWRRPPRPVVVRRRRGQVDSGPEGESR